MREGDPAKVIVSEAAHDPGITLVVMSTHGRSGLGRWFFGSVSEKVLHASPVPLLLVRPEGRKEPVRYSGKETYHKIMVPLDESSLAEQALEQARVLALDTGATLVLVLATPPLSIASMSMYMEATSYQMYVDAWEGERERLTRYVADKAEALRADSLQVETQIAQGNPSEVILLAVDQADPDLIVMSTHGGGSSDALQELQELLLGSVALKVVQEARLPALLIPVRETPSTQERAGEPAEASPDESQSGHSDLAPVLNVEVDGRHKAANGLHRA